MVLVEALSMLGLGAKEIFLYNRKGFIFNKTTQQRCEYQLQDMRVDQAHLYRDDILDLFDLTKVKMNLYALASTLLLLSAFGVMSNGRAAVDTPSWLFYLWATSATSSILFLLLSAWFAIHASVAAQIYLTRIRTQWLRLPIPRIADINRFAPSLDEFEKRKTDETLRIPIVELAGESDEIQPALPAYNPGQDEEELQEEPQVKFSSSRRGTVRFDIGAHISPESGARAGIGQRPGESNDVDSEHDIVNFSDHFLLYQELFSKFQGYDAFARVALAVGSIEIMFLFGYSGLMTYMLSSGQQGDWAFTIICSAFACASAYLNILLKTWQMTTLYFLFFAGPLLAGTAATYQFLISNDRDDSLAKMVSPIIYSIHLTIVGVYLYTATLQTRGLPIKYAAVINLDLINADHSDDKEGEQSMSESVPQAHIVRASINSSPKVKRGGSSSPAFSRYSIGSPAFASSFEEKGHPESDDSFAAFRKSGPTHTFYGVCIVIMIFWLCGIVISITKASGLEIAGWDTSPVKNVLPYTGQNIYDMR